jgi:hypothetical protein
MSFFIFDRLVLLWLTTCRVVSKLAEDELEIIALLSAIGLNCMICSDAYFNNSENWLF